MDAAGVHVARLLKRAQAKRDTPVDGSFLPLALAISCLHRHPPPPLAQSLASSSLFALSDPQRTPVDVLDKKLWRELASTGDEAEDERLIDLVRPLVVYVRVARGVLSACSDYVKRKSVNEDEACEDIVAAVLGELWTEETHDNENLAGDENPDTFLAIKPPPSLQNAIPKSAPVGHSTLIAATDPSGIVKRAVGMDTGNGRAVLTTMKRFVDDERIQTHGVRALKGVVRLLLVSSDREAELRNLVGAVIDRMVQFPAALGLQRDGLLCLRDVAATDERVRMVTSLGGVGAIVNALAHLPDDVDANIAGLAVLAHPSIAEESTIRVDPESRRLVLSAMQRFLLDEQIQGLGALALGNLSLRQDASLSEIVAKGGLEVVIASMARFDGTALVQAAGCRFVAIASTKDELLAAACLQAGALPACEKARVRYTSDPKIQQYALQAIEHMEQPARDSDGTANASDDSCLVQ